MVVTLEAVRAKLSASGFADWQLPDRIELIDEVPKTGVGKFDKKVLRARFAGPAPGSSGPPLDPQGPGPSLGP
jgi:non-ribosomal peptide synthetase component E (peptide arylation enzyme)